MLVAVLSLAVGSSQLFPLLELESPSSDFFQVPWNLAMDKLPTNI